MSAEFDQQEYWLSRHKRLAGDPRSVGNLAETLEQNRAGEIEFTATAGEAAKLLRPARSVLDVGCGYGRIARSFTENAYSYLGVDISPVAIEQACARGIPGARFVQGELSTWETSERFDLVCALYVFVHFVDDAKWRSLLLRTLTWLAPGGALLLADHFPLEREQKVAHVVSRPFRAYEEAVAASGFAPDPGFAERLVARCPRSTLARHFRLIRRLPG